jgi:hypothetical protein
MQTVILEYGAQRYTVQVEHVAQIRRYAPWLKVRTRPRLRLVRGGRATSSAASNSGPSRVTRQRHRRAR